MRHGSFVRYKKKTLAAAFAAVTARSGRYSGHWSFSSSSHVTVWEGPAAIELCRSVRSRTCSFQSAWIKSHTVVGSGRFGVWNESFFTSSGLGSDSCGSSSMTLQYL